MTDLIIEKDEALTPEEYERARRKRDRVNARTRERWATDPEFRARAQAAQQRWKAEHREHVLAQKREYMRRRRAQ